MFKQTTRTMIMLIHAATYFMVGQQRPLGGTGENLERRIEGKQTLILSFQKPMTIEAADISAHRVMALEYQFYPSDVSG
jgi:hypothetical protein